MKPSTPKSPISLTRVAAALTVAGCLAIAAPVGARSTQSAASAQPSHVAVAKTTTKQSNIAGASHSDRVEARISELRSRLKITADQDSKWNEVTQIMRDNAHKLDEIAQRRTQKDARMTALDDLNSYSEMVDARADGLKRFIPAFQSLYDSMSDAQKKQADALFQGGSTRMASRTGGKAGS